MRKAYFRLYGAVLLLGSGVFGVSCNDDINTIGTDIIGGGNFETEKVDFEVYAYNRKLAGVQTNGLPLYQLGVYNDPVYGKTEASIISQLGLPSSTVFGTSGDNNEQVKTVYLNIPFFSTVKEGQTETNDNGEPVARQFEIDSVFGNKTAEFRLRVEEFTYYLRDLDPGSDFGQQEYFSNNEELSSHVGAVLRDDVMTIDDREILVMKEDDPDTDEDESEEVDTRLSPRIRVELEPEFFQQILDREGSEVLSTRSNFQEFIKGLRFSVGDLSDDMLMLLDWNNASVEVVYTYEREDTSSDNDDTVETEASFTMSLAAYTVNSSNGARSKANNVVNIMHNEAYPAEIADQLDTGTNASSLYLKGGAGTVVELSLFDEDREGEVLADIRAKQWVINDASLTFYVDREKLDAYQVGREPSRVYVYNLDDNSVLADVELDYTTNQDKNLSRLIYGGVLEEENDKGIKYKIRLTEHIDRVVNKDSANVRLGLALTASINNTMNVSALDQEGDSSLHVPEAAVLTPLGTILYGNNVEDEAQKDKRLKLELYYTEID
ncbi:DUF4270 domain-containing protein [Sinomicrobium soli]|uniref:DUF4270 domain-containing protein n=1 Tax=Sinomicrobium sp. N-1-3-6 TaxID=2219864 RepID=UPI000DCEE36D|nr:DUF4270 domain-containing protein [Sinomicrobium sp. N-1-3-6]RAV28279.1 DUF4270 domain-containing protein [Sinomicrobium sp. N-1-3-6]